MDGNCPKVVCPSCSAQSSCGERSGCNKQTICNARSSSHQDNWPSNKMLLLFCMALFSKMFLLFCMSVFGIRNVPTDEICSVQQQQQQLQSDATSLTE